MKIFKEAASRVAEKVAARDQDTVRGASGDLDLTASIAANREVLPPLDHVFGTGLALRSYQLDRERNSSRLQAGVSAAKILGISFPFGAYSVVMSGRDAAELAIYAAARQVAKTP